MDAVEAADMPDVGPVEKDDASPLGKSHRNTVQYSRHDDVDDSDQASDTDSAAEMPSSDEQDEESENDDNNDV